MTIYALHMIYLWATDFYTEIQRERRETAALIKIVELLKEEEKQMIITTIRLQQIMADRPAG